MLKLVKVYDGYYELGGYSMEKNDFVYYGSGWCIYSPYGIRLAGFDNFQTAKSFLYKVSKD